MKKETIWNIVLVVSLILIIHGMTNAGDKDKKTAQAAQGEAATGVGGMLAFALKKQIWPWYAFLAIAGAIPFVFTQYKNLISPPTIPGWAWIAGFLVLILLVLKNK